jgi:hypothetical protein
MINININIKAIAHFFIALTVYTAFSAVVAVIATYLIVTQ